MSFLQETYSIGEIHINVCRTKSLLCFIYSGYFLYSKLAKPICDLETLYQLFLLPGIIFSQNIPVADYQQFSVQIPLSQSLFPDYLPSPCSTVVYLIIEFFLQYVSLSGVLIFKICFLIVSFTKLREDRDLDYLTMFP